MKNPIRRIRMGFCYPSGSKKTYLYRVLTPPQV